eukprot:COSAG02_NODE_1926_length_10341_cov_25.525776_11_plen_108_part_00
MELGHQMTSAEISQMMAAMDKTGSNTVTREGALPFSPLITPLPQRRVVVAHCIRKETRAGSHVLHAHRVHGLVDGREDQWRVHRQLQHQRLEECVAKYVSCALRVAS